MFRKTSILAACAIVAACALRAPAEGIPQRDIVDVAAGQTAEFTIPHYGNGQLLSVQLGHVSTNGVAVTDVTAAVKHVARWNSAASATNTVLAAATNLVLYAGSAIPATHFVPGDTVLCTLSSTGAVGKVALVRDGR
jgi:hypothetical protein